MREELPKHLNKWKTFGAFVGMKKKRGRWVKSAALVCLTPEKGVALRKTGSTRPVVGLVSWREGKSRFGLATDVIQVKPTIDLQAGAIFGPGDSVEFEGDFASVGAAVEGDDIGRCLTTAGHLVGGKSAVGRVVSIASGAAAIPARIVDAAFDGASDYALLRPNQAAAILNRFRDRVPIGPVFTPTVDDRGAPLFVLDGRGRATATVCRGVDGHIFTAQGSFNGVILTDPVTLPGQSGGSLIDERRRLWGFLIGQLDGQFSIFAPAQFILDAAGVRLIQG